MKAVRMMAAAFAALLAGAAFAEEAPQASVASGSELMRLYDGLVKASGGRAFTVNTNGAAIAGFLGRVFGEYTVWRPEIKDILDQLPAAAFTVHSSLAGDRVDVSVSARPQSGTKFARELAALRPVQAKLLDFVPYDACALYATSTPPEFAFDLCFEPLRDLLADSFRRLLPQRSFAAGFALYAAPAVHDEGLGVVGVFPIAPGVKPDLAVLAGKRFASLYTVTQPKTPGAAGVTSYALSSSMKDVLGGASTDLDETLKFIAAANGVMGPMPMEIAERNGCLVFEIGPKGDLAARLARSEEKGYRRFDATALLPLQRPGMEPGLARTVFYASPSVCTRQAAHGLGSLSKLFMSSLAPKGDGMSSVALVEADGTFLWGWSLTRSEIESIDQNVGTVRKILNVILMNGVQQRLLGGGQR